jgi:phosphohistidine phosphatase
MKTLLVLRHAKSSWADDDLSDFDRPLNDRGRHDAPRMGQLMAREDLVPDLIITSSAKRAATTAKLVAQAAGYEGEIRRSEHLYLAEPGEYVVEARQVDDGVACLMVVGHNPGIEELVEWLSGVEERMPTAALACFRLSIDHWRDLKPGQRYELTHLWRPKEL